MGLCFDSTTNSYLLNKKLICESSAATLEAYNKDLVIPKCGDELAIEVHPSTLPVSAVFVACTDDSKDSCLNYEWLQRES